MLHALEENVMRPEFFAEFCREFTADAKYPSAESPVEQWELVQLVDREGDL